MQDFLGLADWGLHQEGLELGGGGRGEERGFLGPFDQLSFYFRYFGRNVLLDESVQLIYVEPGRSGFVFVHVVGVFSCDELGEIDLFSGFLIFLIFHLVVFVFAIILKFRHLALLTNGLFRKRPKNIKVLTQVRNHLSLELPTGSKQLMTHGRILG